MASDYPSMPTRPPADQPRDGLVNVGTTWQIQVPAHGLGPDAWQFRHESANLEHVQEVADRIGPDCRILQITNYVEITVIERKPGSGRERDERGSPGQGRL